jgi:hypothetical protein
MTARAELRKSGKKPERIRLTFFGFYQPEPELVHQIHALPG